MYKVSRNVKLSNGKELELLEVVIPAVQNTLKGQRDILLSGRVENSFTSYLSNDLRDKINSLLDPDQILSVDPFWNKHKREPKKIEDKPIQVDIAVHDRHNDENNLLVIELETNNSPKKDDIWKLEKMTKQSENGGEYCYQFGLYLAFGIKGKTGKILDEIWYKGGVKIAGKFLGKTSL